MLAIKNFRDQKNPTSTTPVSVECTFQVSFGDLRGRFAQYVGRMAAMRCDLNKKRSATKEQAAPLSLPPLLLPPSHSFVAFVPC